MKRKTIWKNIVEPQLYKVRGWLNDDKLSKAEICRRLDVSDETMRRLAIEHIELGEFWRADIEVYEDRRSCVYENYVANRFEDIEKWIRNGATVKQICSELEISVGQWYKYLAEHSELAGVVAVGRQGLSSELRGALCRKALGYEYVEKVTRTCRDGSVETTEYTKVSHPDVKAIEALLRNYDETWRAKDDAERMRIEREKLELQKLIADSKIF